jgi:hypothetical protein
MVSARDHGDRSPRVLEGAVGVGHRKHPAGLMLVLVCVPALLALSGPGCSRSINFFVRDAGADVPGVAVVDSATDEPKPGDDGPVADGTTPPDAPVDVPVDRPRDMSSPDVSDVPIDRPPDLPRDVPPDLPRDLRGDAGGPVVCTQNGGECKLPGLFCLIAAGQPGRCVECTGSGAGQCPNSTPRCDPVLNRCVECTASTVGTDCPLTGNTDSEHPSTCTPEHRCLNACDDSSSASGTCAKPGFTCNGGGATPDHVCVDCMVASDCPRPFCIHNVCMQCGSSGGDCAGQAGPICDISGNCVQCGDSRDCKNPGLPLCNPATHTCVAVPP